MAASMDWSAVIRTFVTTDQDNAADEIIQSVKDGATNLLKLVEDLGAFLTIKDVSQRARATRLLADAVKSTPQERLTVREAEILVTFFCERLKDHHFVTPHLIKGLLSLVQYPPLPSACLALIFREIFKEIHVQSLPQMDRRNMLTMISHVLQHRLPDVQDMEGDFVFGFIQVMDGEKDPRNLIIAFKSVVIVATHCNLGVFAEELFEVVACYYPIDFNPPPGDQFGVTKEELVKHLRCCFAATPKFAEFALPLLLEKITSNLSSAKTDAFQTLVACAPVYGISALEEYLGSFWAAIRREVFASSSKAVEESALEALKVLCSTLAKQSNTKSTEYIKEIFQDCKPYLQEPGGAKLAIASGTLLEVAAQSSAEAAKAVLELSLPLLLKDFYMHTRNGDRRVILQVLLPLLKIATIKELVGEDCVPVKTEKNDLLSLFISLFSDSSPSLRTYGVSGVIGMVSIAGLIDEKESFLISEHLSNLVLSDLDESVRLESVRALAFMSTLVPNVILEKVLPALTSRIELSGLKKEESPSHLTNIFLLESISNISSHHELVATTVPLMLNHLKHLVTASSLSQTEKYTEAKAVCNCILNTCNVNISDAKSLVTFQQELLPHCLCLAVYGALCSDVNVLTHKDLVELLATIMRTVVQAVPSARDVLNLTITVFMDNKLDDLLALTENLECKNQDFKPLCASSPWQQTQLIEVLVAVVCSAPENDPIPRLEHLMSRLYDISHNCEHHFSSLSAAKCYAGIVNKLPSGDLLESVITMVQKNLEGTLDAITSSVLSAKEQRAMTLWTWICKAIVLRSHNEQIHFIEKILGWLSHSFLAECAADAFYIVLNEYPDVMSLPQHAKVMFLYRQRVFVLTLPQLKDGYQTAATDFKQFYLSALSYLLRFVPKEVLKNELPPLLPLLIHSLRCEGETVWLASLTTLYDLTFDAAEALTPHVDDLIPLLLTLVKHRSHMRVRLLSLECLGALTTLPSVHLVKHQPQVVRGLVAVLDDHKRVVRKAAVIARSEWCLV